MPQSLKNLNTRRSPRSFSNARFDRRAARTVEEITRRVEVLQDVQILKKTGLSGRGACEALGISPVTIWRYSRPEGTLPGLDRCGRKPPVIPTAAELQLARAIAAALRPGNSFLTARIAFQIVAVAARAGLVKGVRPEFIAYVLYRRSRSFSATWCKMLLQSEKRSPLRLGRSPFVVSSHHGLENKTPANLAQCGAVAIPRPPVIPRISNK